jgi:hypothetical protein
MRRVRLSYRVTWQLVESCEVLVRPFIVGAVIGHRHAAYSAEPAIANSTTSGGLGETINCTGSRQFCSARFTECSPGLDTGTAPWGATFAQTVPGCRVATGCAGYRTNSNFCEAPLLPAHRVHLIRALSTAVRHCVSYTSAMATVSSLPPAGVPCRSAALIAPTLCSA